MRRAVIDIGTNSVKVLVGEVTPGGVVTPVLETSEQTRLGRGFYEEHRLQPGPIAATAAAVAKFNRLARKLAAHSVRTIATSAARDAVNRDELLAAIRREAGLEVEVISGAQEAEWAFAGVCSAPGLTEARLLVLDVGGGSTEFILGRHGQVEFRQSFQLGSVRLFEQLRPGDAPTPGDLERCRACLREYFAREVQPALAGVLSHGGRPERVIGVGGTTAILALVTAACGEFDRELIEAACFAHLDFRRLVERLWALPLADRRRLPGLPPERADVILTGAAIYEAVLEGLGLTELRVSTRGLRFAALADW